MGLTENELRAAAWQAKLTASSPRKKQLQKVNLPDKPYTNQGHVDADTECIRGKAKAM